MITHQPPHTLANLDTLLPRGDLVVSPLAIPMIDDLRPPPGSVFQVCTVYPFLPSPHLCDRPRRCWRLQVSLCRSDHHLAAMHVSPWPAHTAAAGECEYPAVETIVPCSFGRGLMRVGFFTSRSKIKCLGGSPCGNCQRVGHDAICGDQPRGAAQESYLESLEATPSRDNDDGTESHPADIVHAFPCLHVPARSSWVLRS
jgi:hypothetical protein